MSIGPPTQAGFNAWVYSAMGITTAQLPSDSPYLTYAFDVAMDIVNQTLQAASGSIYTLAVYNLGGSNLINFAQDPPGSPNVPGSSPPAPFFANLRQKWGILSFTAGVVQASSDETTSQTLLVQEALKNITLADLQYLKDPWGRQYLAFAQKYGPAVWGLS